MMWDIDFLQKTGENERKSTFLPYGIIWSRKVDHIFTQEKTLDEMG